MTSSTELPSHLKKYVVEQNYDRYTSVDQAVWRYILRQLVSHLSTHAHPVYLEGLSKTGIDIEKIPTIDDMSNKLSEFGWKAVPVSGFIPPAAFMEFQSLGYLPIASDMRTVQHTMYTPAPDIVHEAAGHAPIIADAEYAAYLKKYAAVAKNAIISQEDIELYEVIRDLSDIKESPDSTEAEISECEKRLEQKVKQISYVSEASQLSRMNWWTAEYGMVGELGSPKIFGAGLLSSPGESRSCLEEQVKKIPLSIQCVEYSYDITEPQPQLFVAKDFQHLSDVLENFANTMAFRNGGIDGLIKLIEAKTVNSVELSSGIQISGKLTNVIQYQENPAYLQFEGPSQLCFKRQQIEGHGPEFHAAGYGTAIGRIKKVNGNLEDFDDATLEKNGFEVGATADFEYESGVKVKGKLASVLRQDGKILVLTFENCRVMFEDQILFDPDWGIYDLAIGHSVPTVFGGAADRIAYGETDDFVAKIIPTKQPSDKQKALYGLYQQIRNLRLLLASSPVATPETSEVIHRTLKALDNYPDEWLILLELLEILEKTGLHSELKEEVSQRLEGLTEMNTEFSQQIIEGIEVIPHLPLVHQ